MTAVVKEVYEGFKKAGVPSRTLGTPRQRCLPSKRFNKIDLPLERLEADLRLHRWMIGVVIA